MNGILNPFFSFVLSYINVKDNLCVILDFCFFVSIEQQKKKQTKLFSEIKKKQTMIPPPPVNKNKNNK